MAFKLINSEREKLGFPRDGAERARHAKRRRLSMKGLEPASQPRAADVQSQKFSLQDILTASRGVVRDLWKLLDCDESRSLWSVAAYFWPADQPQDEMLAALTGHSLKTLAALKFRITMKFDFPPYSLLGMSAASDVGQGDEAGEPDPRVEAFLRMPPCCLDPFWGQVVQSDVKNGVDSYGALDDYVATFEKHGRVVSLREEAAHALQRKLAGGFIAKPRAFDRQAASMVLCTAQEHFTARGGKCLKSAAHRIQNAMEVVRKKKIIHHRPKQFGSGMFAFISHQLKTHPGSSRERWRTAWKDMSLQQRSPWNARHRMAVAIRREQRAAEVAQRHEQADESSNTPWKLGDKQFPLTTAWVRKLLAPFALKRTGRAELERVGSKDAERVLDAATYNSADACEAKCKAHLGLIVDDENAAASSWSQVLEFPVAKDACFNLHPGLCQGRDACVLDNMNAFMSQIPKRGALLKFERAGFWMSSQPENRSVLSYCARLGSRLAMFEVPSFALNSKPRNMTELSIRHLLSHVSLLMTSRIELYLSRVPCYLELPQLLKSCSVDFPARLVGFKACLGL